MRLLAVAGRTAVWAVLACALLLSACDGDTEPQATSTAPAGGDERARPRYLEPEHRTHLSICVDTYPGVSFTSEHHARVSAALDVALPGLAEVPEALGEPSVVPGCPDPPLELTGEYFGDRRAYSPKFVSDASLLSPHTVWVYFVPAELYAATVGDWPLDYDALTAQTVCEGSACSTMTVALYVPDTVEAGDLAEGLLFGLGRYDPFGPEPTLDWSVCERVTGTPAPWCRSYEGYKEWRATEEAGSGSGE